MIDRTEHLGRQDGPPVNEAKVIYRPVGVVASIAAYNYPLMFAAMIHSRYLRNAGQGCASPTRILVQQDRMQEFIEASREYYATVRIGDPRDPANLVGPVISEPHRARVQAYIDSAVEDGGEIVAEGSLPDTDDGWWVRPTLIGGLPNDARINQEEIFGPVDEALAIADRFDVGLVTINGGGPTRTDAPNGGWKASGIGRERGEAGIREFLEPVTVQWPVTD